MRVTGSLDTIDFDQKNMSYAESENLTVASYVDSQKSPMLG